MKAILILALMLFALVPNVLADETYQLPSDTIRKPIAIELPRQVEQTSQVSYGRAKGDILADLDLQDEYKFRLTYGNRRTFYLNGEQYKIQFSSNHFDKSVTIVKTFDDRNKEVVLNDLNVEFIKNRVVLSRNE